MKKEHRKKINRIIDYIADNAKLIYEVDGIAGTLKVTVDKEWILKNKI